MPKQLLLFLLLVFGRQVAGSELYHLRYIQGGVNGSFFNDAEHVWLPGISMGLTIEKKLLKHASVGWNIFYTQRGGVVKNALVFNERGGFYKGTPPHMADIRLKAYYVEFPFFLKFELPLSGDFSWHVFSGPSMGLLLQQQFSIHNKKPPPSDWANWRKYENYEFYGDSQTSYIPLRPGYYFGTGFCYHGYKLDFVYSTEMRTINILNQFFNNPRRKMRAFHLLFGIDIAKIFRHKNRGHSR